jgi:hypothetical protein
MFPSSLTSQVLSIRTCWFILLTFCCMGCGDTSPSQKPEDLETVVFAGGGGHGSGGGQGYGVGAGEGFRTKSNIQVKLPREGFERKIIYTGIVEAVVQDFDTAEKKFQELVKQYQGIIAQSELTGTTGTQRTGHWTIRVPVARFEAFMQDVTKLGELQRHKTDSEDKTEEFYDLETHIKNKKMEEKRLQDHLEKPSASLTELLAIEKELSRVRNDIELLVGRRNLIQSLTSLTKVEVTLREIREYKPPSAPTFGTRIERSFENSWTALQGFGADCVLFVVASVPWMPLILLVLVPCFILLRRWLRLRRLATVSTSATG